jgi:hypothetical protein
MIYYGQKLGNGGAASHHLGLCAQYLSKLTDVDWRPSGWFPIFISEGSALIFDHGDHGTVSFMRNKFLTQEILVSTITKLKRECGVKNFYFVHPQSYRNLDEINAICPEGIRFIDFGWYPSASTAQVEFIPHEKDKNIYKQIPLLWAMNATSLYRKELLRLCWGNPKCMIGLKPSKQMNSFLSKLIGADWQKDVAYNPLKFHQIILPCVHSPYWSWYMRTIVANTCIQFDGAGTGPICHRFTQAAWGRNCLIRDVPYGSRFIVDNHDYIVEKDPAKAYALAEKLWETGEWESYANRLKDKYNTYLSVEAVGRNILKFFKDSVGELVIN